MKRLAVVLCAGEYERWTLPYPKSLAPIGGDETVLSRLVGQLRSLDWPIVVMTHKPEIGDACLAMGVEAFGPEDRRYTCATWRSSRELWPEPGVVAMLVGDVVWHPDSLAHSLAPGGAEQGQPLRVHGNHAEMFAVTYPSTEYGRVDNLLDQVIDHAAGPWGPKRKSGIGKLFNFYRLACGFPIMENIFESSVLLRVSDGLTTDVDTPQALEQVRRLLSKHERRPGG